MNLLRRDLVARSASAAILAGLIIGTASCTSAPDDRPELHPVAGTVTMDGQPLADARVVFTPKGGGRPIVGITDGSGAYRLEYSLDGIGAPAGDYVISISTQRSEEEDPDTGATIAAAPETVPVAYNVSSTLSAQVPGDAAAYKFDLKSDAGKVVQRGTGVEPSGDPDDGC